jgi:hypothetical protein
VQRIELDIPRLRRYEAADAFEVYADLGSGQVDYDHPMPPGRARLWPDAAPRQGHLLDGHLALRHLDSVDPDGHLHTLHLAADHLYPAWPVRWESPAYVFGRFQHAVRVFDGFGGANIYTQAAIVHTINSAPSVPANCRFASHDEATDRIVLTFDPSRFHPIVGN